MKWTDINFANPPKVSHLYHYQKFEENWIKALVESGRIKFSVPGAFNDPWDCRPCYDKSFLDDPDKLEEQIQYFIDASRRQTPHISEEHRQKRAQEWRSDKELVKRAIDHSAADIADAIDKQYRVYCLTPKPDCQLMWAHYAACHTGICLEFSTDNEIISGAFKVEYLDKYPVLNFSDDTEIGNILPLITKASAWAYESEYRLISEEEQHAQASETLKTNDDFFNLPAGILTGIIMGCRMKEPEKDAIRKILSQSNVQLKSAVRVPDQYELKIINEAS